MAGKKEVLRKGDTVEIEPGVRGWLNKKNKTLQLENGTALPISDADKRELFPSSERETKYAETKEKTRRDINSTPFGEFFHQATSSSGVGGLRDLFSRASAQTADEYLDKRRARQEISQEISEESPYTSMAGTAASFIPDIALTGGMSAVKAAPLLTAASAGSRIIDEPVEVGKEALVAAGSGYLLDKFMGGVGKMAARRHQARQLPGQQEAVRQANVEGAEQVAQANIQTKQNFFKSQNDVKARNDALIKTREGELLDRKNKMIESNNAFEKAKVDRKTQIGAEKAATKQQEIAAKNRYEIEKREYDEAVKNLPIVQKQAQTEYSNSVVKNAEEMQKIFPKDSKIPISQLDVNDFIDASINKTGLAASKEGAQASRILKSIFPEGEILSSNQLAARYRAIEDAIQKATPEVGSVLNEFKTHLGQRLPLILEDTIAFSKVMPLLKRYLEKDVIETLKKVPGLDRRTIANIKFNANRVARNIDSANFVDRLGNGQISREIVEEMAPIEHFLTFMSKEDIALLKAGKLGKNVKGRHGGASEHFDKVLRNAEEKRQAFIDGLTFQINQRLGKYEVSASEASKLARKKLGVSIKGTQGLSPSEGTIQRAEDLSRYRGLSNQPTQNLRAPTPPEAILPPMPPPEIAPPPELPMPPKYGMAPPPAPPQYQTFNPAAEPTLAPPQGVVQKLGDYLEQPMNLKQNLMSPSLNNPLAKLGMLKYIAGKAALPIEAAAMGGYAGLKGLTAPGAEVARQSFKQIGVAAIESMAQKYPSYQNGILQDPIDRRSLTKEIEDDPEVPPSQKALLQSKVNRGMRLNDRLQ